MLKRPHGVEKHDLVNETREQNREHKLYLGNLDHRVTEYHIIKMFSPFGKIRCEEYMWHTHGPKRGEPRGFAFVEYHRREDAERAKESMNGRMAFGRPLVVRFVDEKVVTHNADAPLRKSDSRSSSSMVSPVTSAVSVSRSAKIAAIQNKLKVIDGHNHSQGNDSGSRKKSRTSASEIPRGSQS
ncbi:unnamed protein product [Calypogeia fissa]